jgi:branched-chain amino acid transport system permease protein
VDTLRAAIADRPVVARAVALFGPAAALLAVQQLLFPAPAGVLLRGVIVGLLGALLAVGMGLIYRSNRILNFAQSDLGGLPGALAVLLITFSGLNYFLAFAVGLVAAVVVGAVIELAIIRRFFRAPRLILTVATIGLSQLLAVAALLLPKLWGERPNTFRIDVPIDLSFEVSPIIFSANDLLALVIAPLAMIAVGLWLRFSDIGVAVRASAESADRANLLGVPVKRLQTVVWVVATVLSFLAVFLRAGILGLPFGSAFTFSLLLSALAALTLGRLTDLPTIAITAVALGILELAVDWNAESPLLIDPIIGLVIVVGLLVQRRGTSRAELQTTSTWHAADEVRPIPPEVARLPEVRALRTVGGLALLGAVLALPHLLGAEDSLKASAVLIFAIVGISIVMLTGWAGQVSLGQMGFVGAGAAVAAVATSEWGLDLTLALPVAGLVGAALAVVVGLPALRLQGLFLAVTTLAFTLAMSSYFLNEAFFEWIPTGRVERPPLFGRISLDSPTRIYYLVLGVLVLVLVAARGIRASRTGRVLIALRENERSAQSFGVNVVRAKLSAFALSGFIAAVAGALLVEHQQAFSPELYGPFDSFNVFIATVVGGLGSLAGGVFGALFLRGSQWFLPTDWRALAAPVGVLLVLLILPGGIGGLWFEIRDAVLRQIARRRGLLVPSLLADEAEQLREATLPDPEVVPEPEDLPEPLLTWEAD